MTIIIKEIRVVSTVVKQQDREIAPEWLKKIKELLRESKMSEQEKRKNER